MVAAVIDQEDVNRVCNDLSSTGKTVNISTVFKELGRGGPNTIKKYIACWREETETEGNTEIAVIDNDLPDDYKNQVMAMGKALFNAAEKEMQATVTRINAEKEEAIAKAEDELKEVSDVAEQLNSKNIELQEQLQEQLEITSKLKKEKVLGDTKLIEVQTELKILIATSKEKEKSKMALEDQLKTLKSLIEKEAKPRATRVTKKTVKN